MKRWMYLTGIRLLAVTALCLLLAWLLVYKPQADARSTIKQQQKIYQSAISSTEKADKLISSLPDITAVGTRQPGNFASYAADCNNRLKQLDKTTINNREPHKIASLRSLLIIKDVNAAVAQTSDNELTSVDKIVGQTQSLLSYHCRIMTALTNVLEYNPSEDTQGFQPGSNNAKTRLELAKNGLDKTVAVLSRQMAKYPDASFNQLQNQITTLQIARNKLAKDGDKAAWISAFSQTQAQISGNRESFWSQNSSSLSDKITDARELLAKRQALWYNLTIKYKIN